VPIFSGRVEARLTIPTGGAAVSASNGAQSAASTVTVPAASYYLTAAGGVSSLLTTLQDQLNQNGPQGYPTTAASMQAAVGYGTWSAGWSFNITSGNDTGLFGGVTMTAASTPTYSNPGPRGGIDLAVGFNSNADSFGAGNNYDLTAATDVGIAWVGYHSATPTDTLFSKYDGGTTRGYSVSMNAGALQFQTFDGATTTASIASLPVAAWYVGIAVADRSTGKIRVGYCRLDGSPSVSTEQTQSATTTNTVAFAINASTWLTGSTDFKCAAAYVAHGASACSGLSANLSTALQNFANAVNSSFTVAFSTSTGLATISNSFWPSSVAFTNTTLRDVLGFAYDFDYPQTTAQMTAACGGYGGWSAGYLLNESASPLAPVFGSASLTGSGTPVYSELGPRGGSDKAVATNGAGDSWTGGDNYDTDAGDLCVCAVIKIGAASNGDILGKGWATSGYVLAIEGAGDTLSLYVTDGVDTITPQASGFPRDEWCVVMGVIDRVAGTARCAWQGLRSGSSGISSAVSAAAIGALNSAGNFTLGASGGFGSHASMQIGAFYIGVGTGVGGQMSANLAAIVSSFATYMKSQTSTQQARGLWFPDCPINLEGDPERAPIVSDARSSMSPTGEVVTLVGNTYRRHRNIVWSHVPIAQVWDGEATYENGSWEEFFSETQLGLGSSWFSPGSLVQIYWSNAGTDSLLGADATIAGWSIIGLNSIEPQKSSPDWTGHWRIELPRIVAVNP
jgi:hypothetical protein